MNRLRGKRAFLTAAGAGIGEATAIAFAAEGAHVIATDIKAELIESLKAKGVAETYRLDVRDSAAVKAMAEKVGPVDVVFNCAGFVHHGTVLTTSEADWDLSFDINVKSMHRTISAFLPAMLKQGHGSIINISSGAGLRGVRNMIAYATSKWALRGMSKCAALDLAPDRIRVNSIHPGVIQTPMLSGNPQALNDAMVRATPIGRIGQPEDIARMALYLASDAASFITGAEFAVDGGAVV